MGASHRSRLPRITYIGAVLLAFSATRQACAFADSAPAVALAKMAQARFGVLTDAESRMLRAAPTRELAWASSVEDPDAPDRR